MVTLSQEIISVGIMVIVCTILSLLCVLIWLLRWRRNQFKRKEQLKREDDNNSYKEKQSNKSFSKQAVADTVKEPKIAESAISVRSKPDSEKEVTATPSNETNPIKPMGQYEARVTQAYVSRPLELIKEESTPIRNKRLDTVSVTASMETLQRNDSKVNVFPADKMEEIDLNPGLNSIINLETI